MNPIRIFVEVGQKRTFTSAVDWPGWCRSGRDEASALQALLNYGPRYAQVIHPTGVEFQTPRDAFDFTIIERQAGNPTTDFGAPAVILEADWNPIDQVEFERLQTVLQAGWRTFDQVMGRATSKELRKGPRGGGRDMEMILEHVLGADQAYLGKLAWKYKREAEKNPIEELGRTRQAILDALEAARKGDLPEQGPRGGSFWPPRYFIRRVAWHVVDHAWEIEDRIV